MKSAILCLLLLWLNSNWNNKAASGSGQKTTNSPRWDSLVHWKLYQETNFQRVFRVSTDSLSRMESRTFNDDSIHFYLRNAEKIEGVNPVWMGCYLVSCEDNKGALFKVVIGHYGGIVYWQQDGSYYQIPEDLRSKWMEYVTRTYMAFRNQQ